MTNDALTDALIKKFPVEDGVVLLCRLVDSAEECQRTRMTALHLFQYSTKVSSHCLPLSEEAKGHLLDQ